MGLGVIVVSFLMPLAPVYAQCIAGLPCVADHSSGANDSKSDSAACDADFMNQIYARAFIESDREVAVAQQYVSRPDSVLELSCFDATSKEALEAYNPYFSANSDTPGAVAAGQSFTDVIKPAVRGYIDSFYSDDLFTFESGAAFAYEASPCDFLMSVQFLSRCANVDTVGEGFYSFDTLTSVDPRIDHLGLACPGTAITEDLLKVATNDAFEYVAFDVFEEYSEQMAGDSCSDPVGTGLFYEAPSEISWTTLGEYIFGAQQAYEHKVCVNPSCFYDIRDGSCKAK